jgi:hypothetical protein
MTAHIQFGPYKQFKPDPSTRQQKYKYPYEQVTQTGREFGFFVGVKKKPTIPKTLKNRVWRVIQAQHPDTKDKGWYVYVHQFTNGFDPNECDD